MKYLTQCFRVSSFQKASQASYIRSKAHSNQDPSKFHGSEALGADKNKDYYHGLRIYQNHSWFELINLLGMTTVCSNDYFVNNCHKFYTLGRKVFGTTLTIPFIHSKS